MMSKYVTKYYIRLGRLHIHIIPIIMPLGIMTAGKMLYEAVAFTSDCLLMAQN